ncbi:hypothetical protein COB72_03210 [bacterium]|nr:MAG: hypothetical protein COB72_03210 [bacterium]
MTEPLDLKPNNSNQSNSEPCPSTPSWALGRAALSVRDVAAVCGVSAKSVRRWISNEGLPSVRICGAGARAMTFILPIDLDAWFQTARHDSSQAKDQDQSVQIRHNPHRLPLHPRHNHLPNRCVWPHITT